MAKLRALTVRVVPAAEANNVETFTGQVFTVHPGAYAVIEIEGLGKLVLTLDQLGVLVDMATDEQAVGNVAQAASEARATGWIMPSNSESFEHLADLGDELVRQARLAMLEEALRPEEPAAPETKGDAETNHELPLVPAAPAVVGTALDEGELQVGDGTRMEVDDFGEDQPKPADE